MLCCSASTWSREVGMRRSESPGKCSPGSACSSVRGPRRTVRSRIGASSHRANTRSEWVRPSAPAIWMPTNWPRI